MLSIQRSSEKGEIDYVKKLYGLTVVKQYVKNENIIMKILLLLATVKAVCFISSNTQTAKNG